MSALGDFVRGSLAGEDAKNRYPSAARLRGVANLFKDNEMLNATPIDRDYLLLGDKFPQWTRCLMIYALTRDKDNFFHTMEIERIIQAIV